MKRLILLLSALLVMLLAACAAQTEADPDVENAGGPLVTVYRAPT
ncbi:MAG: hypothetical protein R3293_06195 [Candidatus Promineifilaceae bacterium]|nr:hypothetical protein [Candidatus Promineifilaceae bacterium]